jgi:hypothetical protein
LEQGLIVYPREKANIPRMCDLWTETTEALRQVIAERPEPRDKSDHDRVFLTAYGRLWVRGTDNAITSEFNKVRVKAGVKVRKGRSFTGMDATYVNRFKVERLKVVTEHIHDWLYARRPCRAKGRRSTTTARPRVRGDASDYSSMSIRETPSDSKPNDFNR